MCACVCICMWVLQPVHCCNHHHIFTTTHSTCANANLTQTHNLSPIFTLRIDYLDNELLALQDQLSGLQVQKEKALADLSAIRKTNKDMERSVAINFKFLLFVG